MNGNKVQRPTYRVVEIFTNWFTSSGQKEVTETVIWEGMDLDELSQRYPPSNVWGADQLSHHELEDGYLRWDYRFECQLKDGTWEECDDPRHRVDDPDFLALEREIDAENRRMYPGDYMDDEWDDDPYYDDYEDWEQ